MAGAQQAGQLRIRCQLGEVGRVARAQPWKLHEGAGLNAKGHMRTVAIPEEFPTCAREHAQ